MAARSSERPRRKLVDVYVDRDAYTTGDRVVAMARYVSDDDPPFVFHLGLGKEEPISSLQPKFVESGFASASFGPILAEWPRGIWSIFVETSRNVASVKFRIE